jgi:Protein of unknown function (DUF3386)
LSVIDVAKKPSADDVLRRAHEASYRLPEGFPGFRAELRLSGPVDGAGEVAIRPRSRPRLTIDLPETDAKWLEHELSSLGVHRFHRPYEAADGPTEKRLETDDRNPHGDLIVLEDAMGSSYRVGDGLINEISRTHGGGRFTIAIQDRAEAPGGTQVSTAFTVFHWAAEGGHLSRVDAYSDAYVDVGGLLLPARRRIASASEDGLVVRQIELGAHEILNGEEES